MKKVQTAKVQVKKIPGKPLVQQKKTTYKPKYFNLIGIAIIILLGILAYSNSFLCSFQFDDYLDIVYNPRFKDLADIKNWLIYVPSRSVGNFTFVLNYHFNKLDVRYYHYVNLCIHLINALLVRKLTLLIFSSPAMKEQAITKHKNTIAFFTALLFVSHPMATQAVTYIIQRLASLVTLFYLSTIVLYMKGRLTENNNIRKYAYFAGALLAAMLAVFTKENSYTLPFTVILVEFFFLRVGKFRINLKDYRVLIAIAVVICLIYIIILKYPLKEVFKTVPAQQGYTYNLNPYTYLLTQFSVILKYIQLLIIPVGQTLDHDFPINQSLLSIRTLLSLGVLLLLISVAVLVYKRHRVISFGIFWFFITLAVESSIIPIPNIIFEHRTYLPMFGFVLVLCSIFFTFFYEKYKYPSISVLVIIIGINSQLTYERNKVWKDHFTLWNDAVEKSPNKARPYSCRGNYYNDEKQWENAIIDFNKALEISPTMASTFSNRGIAYCQLKQFDKAIPDFTRAIEIEPAYITAYSNRGKAYSDIGQWDKALLDYSKVIKLDPNNIGAYLDRIVCYRNLNQWDKVFSECKKAYELDPQNAKIYFNRAFAYGSTGQLEQSLQDFTKSIELDPGNAQAYFNRGVINDKLGKWQDALSDYSRASEMDPSYTEVYNSRKEVFKNMK